MIIGVVIVCKSGEIFQPYGYKVRFVSDLGTLSSHLSSKVLLLAVSWDLIEGWCGFPLGFVFLCAISIQRNACVLRSSYYFIPIS
jgi:hypothetical protein